nr:MULTISPECIES: nucleotidyltransferase domain-containing protein [unclassified Haloferax]
MSDGRSEALSALREAVRSDSDIKFVVTLGSQIMGGATMASDLDIAVKFADSLSARDRFEKQCFLSGDLQWEDAPFVDVSDIETLPLDVAHDAVRVRSSAVMSRCSNSSRQRLKHSSPNSATTFGVSGTR